jgi:phosphate transport system substrate-binding protein
LKGEFIVKTRATLSLAVIVVAVFSALLSGCANRQASTPTPASPSAGGPEPALPGITKENFPVVNGSTSTIPLTQLMLSRSLGLRGEMRRVPMWGEISAWITFAIDDDPGKVADFRDNMRRCYHSGTHPAYVALLSKRENKPISNRSAAGTPSIGVAMANSLPDLILVARKPSPDEIALAKRNKVEMDIRPVALDAFIFLVNDKNPVESLTLDQIRSVFTGKVTSWRELGGKDEPIRAYTRERNSGSQELMDSLVLKGRKPIQVQERILYGMSDVIDRVASDEQSVSYSVYYYEHVMMPNANNRLLAIDSVLPTSETIASRKYPLTAEVYVVTRKDLPSDSPGAKLRDWLLSADGQQLVASSGYVPID